MDQENDENLVKITDICRACLSRAETMKFLLEDSEEILSLLSKFSSVSNLEIEIGYKYPSYLCTICEEKILNSYEFQQQCHKSNDLIQEYLAVFEKQDTVPLGSDPEITLTNLNTLEKGDIAEELQNTTQIVQPIYEEISNPSCEDSEQDKAKYDKKFQEDLSQANLDLKEKYSKLEEHKCNRGKRKWKENLDEETKTENNTLQKEEEEDNTYNPPDEFKNFTPVEIPLKNKTLQKLRLKQYSVEDVNKAMNIIKKKFYKHVNCIFCTFTAVTNRSLSVHVTRVHREYKNKWCSSCNQVTENQTSHNKEVHHEDLKCPFCRKIKNNMGHFMEHLASHSAERSHKCNICIKSFISQRHLRIHKETHKLEFKCEVCNKTFMQAVHLRGHLKSHQSPDQNSTDIQSDFSEVNVVKEEGSQKNSFNCKSECNETQDQPEKPHNYCKDCNKKVRSLLSHYLQHHNKKTTENTDRQNLCPHCGKRFKTTSKLTVHIRTHTGESPYKCQYCDKWVKTRNILIVHERTHTGEKPYMCTICGKSFAQSSVLNTHTRIHTGRPEQCTICEKRFCRPAELRLHMRKHTGEKPYMCPHCGLGFKQKSHLVEHTKTHNDDRPYQCEFCEKAFKNRGTLKCHVQIHSGQKPFKCSQCSYACRQPYSLTQHMVQHENDKPQLDYPYKCQICQRNFATTAHLTAHYNRFHPDLKIKFLETFEQLPTHDNQMAISESIIDAEVDQDDQNNYQISEEAQIESSQISLVESVENVDTMIIQTEIQDGVGDEIKYEPIQIQFSTLHEL